MDNKTQTITPKKTEETPAANTASQPVSKPVVRSSAEHTQRRRNTREHVLSYLKAFNAWAQGQSLSQLRADSREPLPPITRMTS